MEKMEKTIEEFATSVKEELERKCSCRRIVLNKVVKNNDTELLAVTVGTENENITPNIYLNEYYKDYCAGRELSDIVQEIISLNDVKRDTSMFNGDINELLVNKEKVLSKVCYRLVNREKNKKRLEKLAYLPYNDLAVIFNVPVSIDENGVASLTLENKLLEKMNISLDELLMNASKNTPEIMGTKVQPMESVLFGMLDEEIAEELTSGDNLPIYIVTNKSGVNGASTILNHGVLEKIAERLNTDSLYLLPSSVHEFLVLPTECGEVEELNRMVRETNSSVVNPMEILSDHAYYYSRETGQVESTL